MNFFIGLLSGIAASLGYTGLAKRLFSDPDRPPWISEYYVRSIWLELAGFYDLSANPPFTENDARAEIVIVGGGLTGLSSAYHLKKRFPDKRIVLLEAARCGYGASGRNGGILQDFDNTLIMDIYQKKGRKAAQHYFKVDRQGPILVRTLIKDHKIDCDLEECGLIELALDQGDMKRLIKYHEDWKSLGIASRIMNREELRQEIISDRYCGGLHKDRSAVLNPAKFALGLKSVLETLGVEIFECTKVVSIQPGTTIKIETEFGNITSEAIVLATNAYSHRIGFFKNRIFPMATYIIATEPLREEQMSSIGWRGRKAMFDIRRECNYFRLTSDNRIVFGGGLSPYFYKNAISSGNYRPSLNRLESDFFKIWPQLKGVRITHKWGGTLAMTLDFHPTIGVMGDKKNIFYGVGYSGHGVSWSQLSGKIISQLYANEDTELTSFYCTNKIAPYLPPEPFRKVGYHLFKRFLL
ncbi:MAG: FAD-binding oxidoreductase [Desulfobacteraceae bacterium]|jgi:glycine/D-amino acid oxidase-like deaminating enzyme